MPGNGSFLCASYSIDPGPGEMGWKAKQEFLLRQMTEAGAKIHGHPFAYNNKIWHQIFNCVHTPTIDHSCCKLLLQHSIELQ